MKVELTCRIEYYDIDLGDDRNIVLEITFHPEKDYTHYEFLENGKAFNDEKLLKSVLDEISFDKKMEEIY